MLAAILEHILCLGHVTIGVPTHSTLEQPNVSLTESRRQIVDKLCSNCVSATLDRVQK